MGMRRNANLDVLNLPHHVLARHRDLFVTAIGLHPSSSFHVTTMATLHKERLSCFYSGRR